MSDPSDVSVHAVTVSGSSMSSTNTNLPLRYCILAALGSSSPIGLPSLHSTQVMIHKRFKQ